MKPSNAISLYLSYAQDIGAKIDHGLRFTLPCTQLIDGLLDAWRVARGTSGGPGLVDIGEMGRIYGKTHGKNHEFCHEILGYCEVLLSHNSQITISRVSAPEKRWSIIQ